MGKTLLPSRPYPSPPDSPPDRTAVVERLIALEDAEERRAFVARIVAAFPADELLPFLKKESERYFAIDSHAALRLADALVMAADHAQRPDARALGLLSKADALRVLGRFQESLDLYEEARACFDAQGNEVGWARTFTGWVYAAHYLGRGAEALAAIPPAHETLMRHDEPLLAARMDQNAAGVCMGLGRYEAALLHLDRAERTFGTLASLGEEGMARAKENKAHVLVALGEFDDARRLHEEARTVYARRGATMSMHRQDHHIAKLETSQGNFTRGLERYRDAFAVFAQAGQDADAAWVSLHMVENYVSLNRNAEAREAAEEAVVRFERCGSPTEAARARLAAALVAARMGEREQAAAMLDAVIRTFAAAAMTAEHARALLERARLSLADGQWDAALADAGEAGGRFRERGLAVPEIEATILTARAFFGRGDAAAAARHANRARAASRARGLHWLVAECHHIRADVANGQGDIVRALDECREAIARIERVRSRLTLAFRGAFVEDKLQVYHDAVGYCLRLGDVREAFAFVERGKSRALVEHLAATPEVRMRARNPANRELVATLGRLRGEHNWLYNQLYGHGIARQPGNGSSDAETESLQAAIRERETRIARLLERLALHHADGPEEWNELLAIPRPTALPALEPGTVLLEYSFHAPGGAVFVATHDALTVRELTATPDDIRRLLQRWQLNLAATARARNAGRPITAFARNARGVLDALSDALIAPVQDALAGCVHLVVVPYGPTHAVPFAALPHGGRPLIEAVEVSVCPSSDLLRLCAARPRRSGGNALVLAHSDGGRLPSVLAEAEAVASLLPGRCLVEGEATRTALIAAAPEYGVIHLAAHGEARLDNPAFAHLNLADGHLTAADVFALDLDGVLVTLSACETGQGVMTGDDEQIGLSGGFLYAGASTLVQSLWRVEDDATAQLMVALYEGIRAGLSCGAALRGAQRALRARLGDDAHPYLWAGFQLVGANRPL